jgi:hypothetical protein
MAGVKRLSDSVALAILGVGAAIVFLLFLSIELSTLLGRPVIG